MEERLTMSEKITGIVETCGGDNISWHIVAISAKDSQPYHEWPKNKFGFIAITAKIGSSSWPTSLLPPGDKKTFWIAIPVKVRKAESISVGDKVTIEFDFREQK